MEIFNIGPLELVLILVIALIVLGPDDMIKTGRSIAKGIRKIIRSPIWKSLVDTSQEIKELPRKFIREAGLEESIEDLNRMNRFPDAGMTIGPPTKAKTDTESVAESETQEPDQAVEINQPDETKKTIQPIETLDSDSVTDKLDIEQNTGETDEDQ
jgi:Sec-independent protein translocase protein TatA